MSKQPASKTDTATYQFASLDAANTFTFACGAAKPSTFSRICQVAIDTSTRFKPSIVGLLTGILAAPGLVVKYEFAQ